MKFRRLENEELEGMQEEFINFLASNSVTGPDWEMLKINTPEKAEELIGLFSDIFWEKVLSKIAFLKEQTPQVINVYHFSEDKGEMVSFQTSNPKINLTDPQFIESLATGIMDISTLEIEMYKGSKNLKKEERAMEVFKLLEKGAIPCSEVLFRAFRTLAQ